jgi:hypothetical protein
LGDIQDGLTVDGDLGPLDKNTKSLASGKGARKKLDKVVKVERERFSQNLRILEGVHAGGEAEDKKPSAWQVLREHIKNAQNVQT